MEGPGHLTVTLLGRPRTPIGRGSGFKTRAVCVRVAPGAPAEEPARRHTVAGVTGHMTPEEFRQHGHEVVDWIADYWSRIGSFPVRSPVAPGDVRAALPPEPPEQGEPFSAVLADLDHVVLPGITHWQHPG